MYIVHISFCTYATINIHTYIMYMILYIRNTVFIQYVRNEACCLLSLNVCMRLVSFSDQLFIFITNVHVLMGYVVVP